MGPIYCAIKFALDKNHKTQVIFRLLQMHYFPSIYSVNIYECT